MILSNGDIRFSPGMLDDSGFFKETDQSAESSQNPFLSKNLLQDSMSFNTILQRDNYVDPFAKDCSFGAITEPCHAFKATRTTSTDGIV